MMKVLAIILFFALAQVYGICYLQITSAGPAGANGFVIFTPALAEV